MIGRLYDADTAEDLGAATFEQVEASTTERASDEGFFWIDRETGDVLDTAQARAWAYRRGTRRKVYVEF